jgi:hypothetical protein
MKSLDSNSISGAIAAFELKTLEQAEVDEHIERSVLVSGIDVVTVAHPQRKIKTN